MTQRQRQFVEELIILKGRNQTEAAIRAGYSPKTAYSIASENLKKPEVREYYEQRKKEIEDDIRQSFLFEADQARNVMAAILNNPYASDKDKIAAARDLLDRAGFAATQKQEISIPECKWFK